LTRDRAAGAPAFGDARFGGVMVRRRFSRRRAPEGIDAEAGEPAQFHPREAIFPILRAGRARGHASRCAGAAIGILTIATSGVGEPPGTLARSSTRG
jgi:hypothetical protein